MSLKIFHVIFVIVSTALAGLCAWWAFKNQMTTFGVASAFAGLLLVAYGFWFLQKSKKIIT